jgi:hypothetical protein
MYQGNEFESEEESWKGLEAGAGGEGGFLGGTLLMVAGRVCDEAEGGGPPGTRG